MQKGKWIKSSFSSGGDNCVEVFQHDDGSIEVRHSRNGMNSILYSPGEWDAFTKGVDNGEFS